MRALVLGSLLVLGVGCGTGYQDLKKETRPQIITGTGATILYPGQGPPPMPSRMPSSREQRTGNSTSSSQQGAPAPNRPNVTMIGGSEGETSGQTTTKEAPAPLALLGLPFWVFGQSLEAEADEATDERERPAVAKGASPAVPTIDDVERRRLERENTEMMNQLGRRSPAPSVSSRDDGGIADELAALERTLGRRAAPESARVASRPPAPGADFGLPEAVDRNGDGKPDLWSYAREGRVAREVIDDDHDGRADRALHYDSAGRLVRAEEDLDQNGSLETVSLYEDGFVARRRADTTGNGQSDAWSFYENGDLVRHEIDRNADGFRDLVTTYANGQLASEREDRNGDGRPDLVTLYEDGQIREKREDIDYDGTPDVQSYYENGKLARRTLSNLEKFDDWLEPEASR